MNNSSLTGTSFQKSSYCCNLLILTNYQPPVYCGSPPISTIVVIQMEQHQLLEGTDFVRIYVEVDRQLSD